MGLCQSASGGTESGRPHRWVTRKLYAEERPPARTCVGRSERCATIIRVDDADLAAAKTTMVYHDSSLTPRQFNGRNLGIKASVKPEDRPAPSERLGLGLGDLRLRSVHGRRPSLSHGERPGPRATGRPGPSLSLSLVKCTKIKIPEG